ncbi:MAG: hypothetical protein J0L96_18445 [Anaerolineae bacterium]|nr:hypothetical protein [Anaerolineae bacterium]
MNKNFKLTKLDTVWTYADAIFENGKSILMSNNSSEAKEFRTMLTRFIAKIKKAWMGKKYSKLSNKNQTQLADLLRDLNKLDIDTINHILLVERGADLLVSLRKIEAPLRISEEEKYITPIDASNWFYSTRLITELSETDAPS